MPKSSPKPESDALAAIFRAADSLRRYLGDRLAPHDLTLQQYNVLRILRGAGGELPTMEIRARMMERAPGITRIVDALVSKGLLERVLPPDDRRRVLCALTTAGSRKLADLDALMNTSDLEALAALSPQRLRELTADLRQISASVADP